MVDTDPQMLETRTKNYARPEVRTPGFMAEPVELPEWERELLEAEHIADALDVVEPRNVVRFPGQRES